MVIFHSYVSLPEGIHVLTISVASVCAYGAYQWTVERFVWIWQMLNASNLLEQHGDRDCSYTSEKDYVFVQTSMILWFQACLKPVLTFHVIIICSTWGLFTKIIQNRCLARGVAKILAAFRWSLAACRRPRAGVWDQEPTQSTLSDRCTLTLKYRM